MQTKQLSKEARYNDRFRELGFGVTLTRGVHTLSNVEGLLRAIRSYGDFTEDNDPYGEHDLGSLNWYGKKVLWKIDYHNPSYTGWEEPLSEKCQRVLTVMLAEEY